VCAFWRNESPDARLIVALREIAPALVEWYAAMTSRPILKSRADWDNAHEEAALATGRLLDAITRAVGEEK
jgi:hypothetical protein